MVNLEARPFTIGDAIEHHGDILIRVGLRPFFGRNAIVHLYCARTIVVGVRVFDFVKFIAKDTEEAQHDFIWNMEIKRTYGTCWAARLLFHCMTRSTSTRR